MNFGDLLGNQLQNQNGMINSDNSQEKSVDFFDLNSNSAPASSPNLLFNNSQQNSQQNINNSNQIDLLNLVNDFPTQNNNDITQLYSDSYIENPRQKANDLIDIDLFNNQSMNQPKSADPIMNNLNYIDPLQPHSEPNNGEDNDLHLNIQFPSDFLTPEEKAKQRLQDIRNGSLNTNLGFGSPELERDFYSHKEEEKKKESQIQPVHNPSKRDNFVLFNDSLPPMNEEEEMGDFDLLTPVETEDDSNRLGFVFPGQPSNRSSNSQEDVFNLAFDGKDPQTSSSQKVKNSMDLLNFGDEGKDEFAMSSNQELEIGVPRNSSQSNELEQQKKLLQGDEFVSLIKPGSKTYSDDLFSYNGEKSNEDLLSSSFDQLNGNAFIDTQVGNGKSSSTDLIDDIFNQPLGKLGASGSGILNEDTSELKIELSDGDDGLEKKGDLIGLDAGEIGVVNMISGSKAVKDEFKPSFDDFTPSYSAFQNDNTNELKIDIPDDEENKDESKQDSYHEARKEEEFTPSFEQFMPSFSSIQNENTNELKIDIPNEEEDKTENKSASNVESSQAPGKEEFFEPSFEQFTPSFNNIQNENTNELKIDIPDEEEDKTENHEQSQEIIKQVSQKSNIEETFTPSFEQFTPSFNNIQNENTNELKLELVEEEEDNSDNQKQSDETINAVSLQAPIKEEEFAPSFEQFVPSFNSIQNENTNELKIDIPDEEEDKTDKHQSGVTSGAKLTLEDKNEEAFTPSFEQFTPTFDSIQNENTNELKIDIPDEEEDKTENKSASNVESSQVPGKEESFTPSFEQFTPSFNNIQNENTNELKLELVEEEEENSDNQKQSDETSNAVSLQAPINEEEFAPSFEQFAPSFNSIQNENTNELKIDIPDEEEDKTENKSANNMESSQTPSKEDSFTESFEQFTPSFNDVQKDSTSEIKLDLPEEAGAASNQGDGKPSNDFSPSFDQFQFNPESLAQNEATNELKIEICDEEDEVEDNEESRSASVVERSFTPSFGNDKGKESESDDSFESLEQGHDLQPKRRERQSAPTENEEANASPSNPLQKEEKAYDKGAEVLNKENDEAKKQVVDKVEDKKEEAEPSIAKEKVNEEHKVEKGSEEIKSEVGQKEDEANDAESIDKKLDRDNGNKAVISESIDRSIFHMPSLPFSTQPVHFSFESQMKPNDLMKKPQFKAVPITKPLATSGNGSSSLERTNVEVAEELRKKKEDSDYGTDRFGILDAFDSCSSRKCIANRSAKKLIIERPSLNEKIEDMKCFSLFKKYLESDQNL